MAKALQLQIGEAMPRRVPITLWFNRIPPNKTEGGFTLLELLVAITILSGSMLILFETLSWSLRHAQRSALALEARILTQTLLAEANAQTAELRPERRGQTRSGLSWRVRVRPYDGLGNRADIQAVVVTAEVLDLPGGMEKTYSLASVVILPCGEEP